MLLWFNIIEQWNITKTPPAALNILKRSPSLIFLLVVRPVWSVPSWQWPAPALATPRRGTSSSTRTRPSPSTLSAPTGRKSPRSSYSEEISSLELQLKQSLLDLQTIRIRLCLFSGKTDDSQQQLRRILCRRRSSEPLSESGVSPPTRRGPPTGYCQPGHHWWFGVPSRGPHLLLLCSGESGFVYTKIWKNIPFNLLRYLLNGYIRIFEDHENLNVLRFTGMKSPKFWS